MDLSQTLTTFHLHNSVKDRQHNSRNAIVYTQSIPIKSLIMYLIFIILRIRQKREKLILTDALLSNLRV